MAWSRTYDDVSDVVMHSCVAYELTIITNFYCMQVIVLAKLIKQSILETDLEHEVWFWWKETQDEEQHCQLQCRHEIFQLCQAQQTQETNGWKEGKKTRQSQKTENEISSEALDCVVSCVIILFPWPLFCVTLWFASTGAVLF